jgi:RNA polymerase-binding protein DksA
VAVRKSTTSKAVPVPAKKATPEKKAAPEKKQRPAVRPDDSPWTVTELREIERELRDDVQRLSGELAAAEAGLADLIRDSGDGAGDDQADAGSKTFEREHEMSLANNARDMLLQVEHALARLANGTYGACETCATPIGKGRLQAFPRATLCLSCKQAEER